MSETRTHIYGSEGSWITWLIFLLFFSGCGNSGCGNKDGKDNSLSLANFLNSEDGKELIVSAMNGDDAAATRLATICNCDVGAVKKAIRSMVKHVAGM